MTAGLYFTAYGAMNRHCAYTLLNAKSLFATLQENDIATTDGGTATATEQEARQRRRKLFESLAGDTNSGCCSAPIDLEEFTDIF